MLVELNSIKFEEKKLKTEILKKNKVIEDIETDLVNMKRVHEELSQMDQTKRDDDLDDEETERV